MIICLLYVGLTVSIIAIPTWSYVNAIWRGQGMKLIPVIVALLALAILNFVSVALPIKLGLKALENRDF